MELAIYEKTPNEVKITVSEIEKSLFSPNVTAHALICEEDGVAVGHVQCIFTTIQFGFEKRYLS